MLKKTHHKKELAEWLKVQALSSSPSTAKKKKVLGRIGKFSPAGYFYKPFTAKQEPQRMQRCPAKTQSLPHRVRNLHAKTKTVSGNRWPLRQRPGDPRSQDASGKIPEGVGSIGLPRNFNCLQDKDARVQIKVKMTYLQHATDRKVELRRKKGLGRVVEEKAEAPRSPPRTPGKDGRLSHSATRPELWGLRLRDPDLHTGAHDRLGDMAKYWGPPTGPSCRAIADMAQGETQPHGENDISFCTTSRQQHEA
jgi:hypothetical protein